MGNDQTIAYKVGGNYVMRTNFPYTSAMDRSELYLTFDARIGNKRVAIPEVKVANGVLATSQFGLSHPRLSFHRHGSRRLSAAD